MEQLTQPLPLVSNPIAGSQQAFHSGQLGQDQQDEQVRSRILLPSGCPLIGDLRADVVQRTQVSWTHLLNGLAFHFQCGLFHVESFLE